MYALRGMDPDNSLTALVLASLDTTSMIRRITILARVARIARERGIPTL